MVLITATLETGRAGGVRDIGLTVNVMMPRRLCVTMCCILALVLTKAWPVDAFLVPTHEAITVAALSRIKFADPELKFSEFAILEIQNANACIDVGPEMPGIRDRSCTMVCQKEAGSHHACGLRPTKPCLRS